MCVTGSTWTDGACVCADSNATWDEATNMCNCSAESTYLINGSCQACPDGSTWTEGACVCDAEATWDMEDNACECSANRTFTAGAAAEDAYTCECFAESTWSSENSACECGTDLVLNADGDGCEAAATDLVCPEGSSQSTTANVCECDTADQYIIGDACVGCVAGSAWDADDMECKCDGDAEWTASTNTCACMGGRTFTAGATDADDYTCDCTVDNTTYDSEAGACVCSGDLVLSSAGDDCEAVDATLDCPTGSSASSIANICDCDTDDQYVIAGACAACVAGSSWDVVACVCDGGATWAAADNTCACAEGETFTAGATTDDDYTCVAASSSSTGSSGYLIMINLFVLARFATL